jgi:3-hydroxy-9,10-secoandrosta-1,3,5(10)-triene-9,17-dione monooxygenase
MTSNREAPADGTHDAVLARVRALTAGIRARAAAAEEVRTLPQESVDAFLAAGVTRILIPPLFGGYGLGLDTWFEAVREISKADASHGWCASLMIHHPHYLSQFPEDAQRTVWAQGLDVPIAASIHPVGHITAAEGGYRVSGEFPFASGVNHSPWAIVGGMVDTAGGREATFFLVPPKQFTINDTWFTTAMRATGSNTIVCDDVYVPANHTVALSDVREGRTRGGKLHSRPIYRAPWVTYAPLTFVTPILGAAQGAYETFRDWTKTRHASRGGHAIAEVTGVQVRLARAAADLDAAELLLHRAVEVAQAPVPASLPLRARSMRDCSRATELCVGVIDTLIGMSGTAGFAETHPIQRAWRDIHFAAMHVALGPEQNFAHFGRLEFGLPRDPHLPFF